MFVSMKKMFPLYHGSRRIFEEFIENGDDGHFLSFLGFHFTKDQKTAEIFARRPERVVYIVQTTVENPLKIKESDLVKNIMEWGGENGYVTQEILDIVRNRPYFSVNEDSISDILEEHELNIEKISKGYKEHLIQQGYDSIEYLNEIEFDEIPNRWDWIVFNSSQIEIIESYRLKLT